jgi:hypothetical protein
LILIATLMAACGSTPAAGPETDRVATGVAEARAIAATLTAGAPTDVRPTAVIARVLPTETAPNISTATQTPLPPTDTAVPPTATQVPPTLEPTVAAPKPPTPTNTAVPQQADPFVPGGGDPKGLIGKMLLPGYGGSSGQVDLPVFNRQIVFQLLVYDPGFGSQDGAGINSVEITIFNPNGEVVHTRTEQNAPYCAFGNDRPECPAWIFAEHGNQWPNGSPVCRGQDYQAIMTINAQNGSNEDALWRFNFGVDGDYPQC